MYTVVDVGGEGNPLGIYLAWCIPEPYDDGSDIGIDINYDHPYVFFGSGWGVREVWKHPGDRDIHSFFVPANWEFA